MFACRRVVPVLAVCSLLAVGAAGAGHAAQFPKSKPSDFDPGKKGIWRFVDDQPDADRVAGGRAYSSGDYKAAASHYMAYLFRTGSDVRILYNLARCYSRMGDADTAVEILNRVMRGGFVHPELLKADLEFEPIRLSKAFVNHLKTLDELSATLGETMVVASPRLNTCRVRLPAGFDATKAYPLVVGLHGNGGSSTELMSALIADAFPGMICAAPDGGYPRTDLSALPGEHWSWTLPDAARDLAPTLTAQASEYVLNVVDDVSKRYRVSHVILLGFSQGVSVAYVTAIGKPDRVAGVIAIAGGLPRTAFTPEQLKAGNRVRVLIGHGTGDTQVPLATSERARDLLRESGYHVQFETFEGEHLVPPAMMRSAGQWIRSWLGSATPR